MVCAPGVIKKPSRSHTSWSGAASVATGIVAPGPPVTVAPRHTLPSPEIRPRASLTQVRPSPPPPRLLAASLPASSLGGVPTLKQRRWLEDVCCWGATSCRRRLCPPSRHRRCRPSRHPRLSQCWSSGAIATKVTGSGLCGGASSVGTCTAIPALPSTSSSRSPPPGPTTFSWAAGEPGVGRSS